MINKPKQLYRFDVRMAAMICAAEGSPIGPHIPDGTVELYKEAYSRLQALTYGLRDLDRIGRPPLWAKKILEDRLDDVVRETPRKDPYLTAETA